MPQPLIGIAVCAAGLLANFLWAVSAGAQTAFSGPQAKLENYGASTVVTGREAFIEAAFWEPARGGCEVLSPDPGFVAEMLVRFGEGGAKSFERRVALVIGNEDYQSIGKLKNPANDATSMARMFRALGFTVYRGIDATNAGLNDCFNRFKADLEGDAADIALFYYAGHGVQLTSQADNEKRNYMLSVDAKVDAAGKASGFKQIDAVLNEMRAHSKQAVFLYDACRNAPFGEGTVKEADGQGVRQFSFSGAAEIKADQSAAASQAGLFIAYATSPGKTADDAWGPTGSDHSPFTEALLKNLPTPGATIDEALARAFNSVGELTLWKQTPWTASSLTSDLKLNGTLNASEIAANSSNGASAAQALASKGLRMAAIAQALKAQPRAWIDGAKAAPFATAKAILARAVKSGDQALQGHQWDVRSAAFTRDGDVVVTASVDKTLRFWNARTGVELEKVEAGSGAADIDAFIEAAISPDGRSIAVVGSDGARLFDRAARTWRTLLSTPGHGQSHAAFSPDGAKLVVVASEGGARILTLATGEDIPLKPKPSQVGHWIADAAFSPDGQTIATISLAALTPKSESTLRLWSAATGEEIRSLTTQGETPTSVVFTPDDSRLIVGGSDGAARVYDVATSAVINTFQGVAGRTKVAISRDGRMAALASGAVVDVFDTRLGSAMFNLTGQSGEIAGVAFSSDGRRLVTASTDRTAWVWDIDRRQPRQTFGGHEGPVMSVAFDAKGARLLTASMDRTARIFEVTGAAELNRFDGHTAHLNGAAFRPDGARVVTWSFDNSARVFDVLSGRELFRLEANAPDFHDAAYSPDGRTIATASSDAIRFWSGESGQLTSILTGHGGPVRSVEFSSDGASLLSASEDNRAGLWSLAPGNPVTWIEGVGKLLSATFSPDGRRILGAGPDGAFIKDLDSARPPLKISGLTVATSAVFSPDGRTVLATSFLTGVQLWDAVSGLDLGRIDSGETGSIRAAFNPNGETIATAEGSKRARLWDVGLYGPALLDAAYALLTDDLRAEVERERVRYWEIDPAVLE